MNILKFLKLTKCYYCNKILPELFTKEINGIGDVREVLGIKYVICKECDRYLSQRRAK